MLGRMCSTVIAQPALAGDARGEDELARPERAAPRPRVTRAKTGMLKMPMAMIALTAPGPKTRGDHDGDEQRREGEDEVV